MQQKYLDKLVCPLTKTPLAYHPETRELWSTAARLAFPVRDGIPVLLENEARPLTAAELETQV